MLIVFYKRVKQFYSRLLCFFIFWLPYFLTKVAIPLSACFKLTAIFLHSANRDILDRERRGAKPVDKDLPLI